MPLLLVVVPVLGGEVEGVYIAVDLVRDSKDWKNVHRETESHLELSARGTTSESQMSAQHLFKSAQILLSDHLVDSQLVRPILFPILPQDSILMNASSSITNPQSPISPSISSQAEPDTGVLLTRSLPFRRWL